MGKKRVLGGAMLFMLHGAVIGLAACGDSDTAPATCPLTECSGECVDTRFDPSHCGACGAACAAGEVCSSGACMAGCPEGQADCGGSCVDRQTNPSNCGSCGNACGAGEVCNAGACALSCGPGTTDCSGACADTMVDPSNCGGCGTMCDAASEVCSAGSCAATCAAPNVLCGGTCIDPMNDVTYCGASGTCAGAQAGETCPAPEACVSGTCMLSWFASCAAISAAGADIGDGLYQIDSDANGVLETVYCDMTLGTTYLEVGFGANFTTPQVGYDIIGASDLSTVAAQQAFIHLYNAQGGFINLEVAGTSDNCCFVDGDNTNNRMIFGPANGYMYPVENGIQNCGGPYGSALIQFRHMPDNGGPILNAISPSFFEDNAPATSSTVCTFGGENPAFFFKTL